ncbi:Tol-Pal system beta propeller repeat protein TolB [Rhodanobacter sp. C03]|uniref:Tol-Pal system beta propeller repeat protein TolB n=1 Tax=Rhodanobacter sp. C03 TaxID=1945858 RepID=UPI0009852897|nr:Tol-Pal system beta propeller repeat protein TolB [Rhodanobacter sp. C03]OOG55681.1 Tol-Pal system beta propeller repeat protein TolB [Rhodanobacter sp. C03]
MRKFSSSFAVILLALATWFGGPVTAQSLNVDIVGGVKTATPIAVIPFAQAGGAPLSTDIADVMRNDFNRSGKFRSLAKSDIVEFPSQGSDIKFATWRLLKQDYILVGRVKDAGGGMLRVEYELWDVNKQQSLLAQAFPSVPAGDLRGIAHQIADQVYEKITGVRGAFWTRIAYITAVGLGNNTTYSLIVADSDGFNPQVVARSKESLLSPAWSPDGRKIAYVSFESGNSNIYIQDITTGSRQLVSSHKGINGAPAFSPDGRKLALALSYVGNPEIYVLDLASRQETRLTNNLAIDTEPTWAPDGQSIFFTSDRSGRPQIYQVPAGGGGADRISFQGQNNAKASVSYDGKQIAMVQGNGNVYRIVILDRSLGGQVRFISPGPIDDAVSFAPNASMLLYAATEGSRGVLYSVSNDGMVRQRLALADGNVQEPAWGPYRQR